VDAGGKFQGRTLLAACAALQAGIFALDLAVPNGVAIGVLYAVVLLFGYWFVRLVWLAVFAASGTALVVAGALIPLPAGEMLWLTIANRALSIGVIGVVALLIQRQRAAAEALRKTDASLRAAQKLMRLGYYQFGPEGEAGGAWSANALEMLGLPADARLSRRAFIDSHVDPSDRGRVEAGLDRLIAHGTPMDLEFRIVRADGTVRHVHSAAEPLELRDGRVVRLIGSMLDVTEHRRMQESLEAREARLRSILETAPEAIITINAAGIVESFSTAAERLFGYSADEVIGRNVSLLMPSPHREQHDAYVRRYLTTGEARIIGIGRVVEGRRKDGSIVPVELAVGEIMLGGARTFTGFLRDLTARQRMEQELRQAQKMEAVGQLTGGIAHDFNNLLTVILGNLEMLQKRLGDDERQQTLLREARETAQLGAQLTDRLLTFGRRQPLQPRPLDVAELTTEMSRLLRRTLGEAVEIRTMVAPDVSRVLADPAQLQNALLNLALNARDAMPRGGTLTIEAHDVELDADYVQAHPETRRGRYVMVAVSDTGSGMTRDVRERAFDPFFTTKGPGAGSGLGLSMVYGFVKQTGGHVSLYSEPDVGTTVRLYLPPAREAPTTMAEAPTEAPAGRGETILVVEDDASVRRVNVARLVELGYNVIEAEDGPAALRQIDAHPAIDVLFTDIVMPRGMSGVELAQAVRQRLPAMPILFSSGYAAPELLESGRVEGAVLLKKPYTAAALATQLREVLDAAKAAQERSSRTSAAKT
jgi:PAS domain S-box-containing protein